MTIISGLHEDPDFSVPLLFMLSHCLMVETSESLFQTNQNLCFKPRNRLNISDQNRNREFFSAVALFTEERYFILRAC